MSEQDRDPFKWDFSFVNNLKLNDTSGNKDNNYNTTNIANEQESENTQVTTEEEVALSEQSKNGTCGEKEALHKPINSIDKNYLQPVEDNDEDDDDHEGDDDHNNESNDESIHEIKAASIEDADIPIPKELETMLSHIKIPFQLEYFQAKTASIMNTSENLIPDLNNIVANMNTPPYKECNQAFFPVFEQITKEQDTNIYSSKMGGNKPFLHNKESWPICKVCEETKLVFLMQINIGELPEILQFGFGRKDKNGTIIKTDLLQWFICSNDDCYIPLVEREETKGECTLFRLIDTSKHRPLRITKIKGPLKYGTVLLKDWYSRTDFLSDHDYENDYKITSKDREKCNDSGKDKWRVKSGFKLSGHPYSYYGVEVSNCGICNKSMQLMIQTGDGEDFIGCELPDNYFFIYQCADHKDQLALGHTAF
jgi:hypothetical protein